MPSIPHSEQEPVMEWLLQTDNPAVRYWALRDLLGKPDDDVELVAARAAIPTSRAVQRIFAQQTPAGHWGDPDSPYQPKYRASYWTFMLLGYLGLSREDERIRWAAEYLFRFQQPCGGFAERDEAGARKECDSIAERRLARGQQPSDKETYVADLIHQYTLTCLTGNVLAALLRLGYAGDAHVERALAWLTSVQHADGGWLCPYWKAHVRDKHSCFYGTISTLEAFAEIPQGQRSPSVRQTAARGAEFLLIHHLYRADHHGGRVIKPGWLELGFPTFYGYNILRGLWVLTRLGCRDPRMADALQVLESKRTEEGKWVMESIPALRMRASLESKGQPSKWLTLMALQVMQAGVTTWP